AVAPRHPFPFIAVVATPRASSAGWPVPPGTPAADLLASGLDEASRPFWPKPTSNPNVPVGLATWPGDCPNGVISMKLILLLLAPGGFETVSRPSLTVTVTVPVKNRPGAGAVTLSMASTPSTLILYTESVAPPASPATSRTWYVPLGTAISQTAL